LNLSKTFDKRKKEIAIKDISRGGAVGSSSGS
jgi:hypothetical protein